MPSSRISLPGGSLPTSGPEGADPGQILLLDLLRPPRVAFAAFPAW